MRSYAVVACVVAITDFHYPFATHHIAAPITVAVIKHDVIVRSSDSRRQGEQIARVLHCDYTLDADNLTNLTGIQLLAADCLPTGIVDNRFVAI